MANNLPSMVYELRLLPSVLQCKLKGYYHDMSLKIVKISKVNSKTYISKYICSTKVGLVKYVNTYRF